MLDAIILAGGRQIKSRSQTPKALIQACGKELIAHQIDFLKDKVRKIVVAVGWGELYREVEEFVDETYPELSIVCVRELEPLGTAGAIKHCLDEIETERFLVVNCDDICDVNVGEMEKIPGNVICVHPPKLSFGIIKKNDTNDTEAFGNYSFIEKPMLKNLLTNCGWYILAKETIRHFPVRGSIEYNVFPKINFNIYRHLGRWNTFNTMRDVETFEYETKRLEQDKSKED